MAWVGIRVGAAVSLAAGLLGACPVVGQEVPVPHEGPWRIILQEQLKKEKGCDLKEVLMYQEIPLGDEIMIEGRVSCLDERAFDFSRTRKHQKFRIELCEPVVC